MRLLLVSVLVLSGMLLSGCLGSDDEPEPTTSSSTSRSTTTASSSTSSTSTTSSSSSTTTPPPANRAPTGSVNAVVNGTNATFSLDGSDPDGDALSWTLDFGDGAEENGASLPATVNHLYTTAGNFSVVYTVTDGKDTATYNVTVSVAPAGGSPGGPVQTVSTSWQVGLPGCAAEYDPWPAQLNQGSGSFFAAFTIDPATIGLPYRMTMTWAATPAGLGGDISFYDAAGAHIDGNLVLGSSPLAFEGIVPAGANHAVASVCDVPGAGIEYVAG